jgi:hypothetical protein
MRIEIAGEGANARFAHPLGELDLLRQPEIVVGEDGITIAIHVVPKRSIQVKRGETRVHLSVEEVFALFHDVTAGLGLDAAEITARLARMRALRAADGVRQEA